MLDGILNTIKPTGVSSFFFMRQVQKKLGIKKIGHLGTLDPNACGVLVLLCGKATKLNQKLSNGEYMFENGHLILDSGRVNFVHSTKVYRSVFTFGIETDTLDSAGQAIAQSNLIPTFEQVKQALPTGKIEIEIPKFSAVHINGQRAYSLARKNIDFVPPKKTVMVYRFELLKQIAENKFWVEIECETGTYVRSLAKLVAQRLGTVAIASSILRTRVGCFDISAAKCLRDVENEYLISTMAF